MYYLFNLYINLFNGIWHTDILVHNLSIFIISIHNLFSVWGKCFAYTSLQCRRKLSWGFFGCRVLHPGMSLGQSCRALKKTDDAHSISQYTYSTHILSSTAFAPCKGAQKGQRFDAFGRLMLSCCRQQVGSSGTYGRRFDSTFIDSFTNLW